MHIDTLLDTSLNYKPPPLLQQHTTEQTYRFINSELYFKRGDVTSTLRALHYNVPPKREVFYNEVRSCRRRLQRDWKITSVAPILSLADEYPNFRFDVKTEYFFHSKNQAKAGLKICFFVSFKFTKVQIELLEYFHFKSSSTPYKYDDLLDQDENKEQTNETFGCFLSFFYYYCLLQNKSKLFDSI